MKGLPPEIDQLMWTLAEDGNAKAQEEFIQRYPTYRQELLRRCNTLSGLRTGRPKTATAPARPIPRFVPKEAPVRASRGTVAMVTTLGLAALALASYTITTMLSPAPAVAHVPDEGYPQPAPVVRNGNPAPSNVPAPNVSQGTGETPHPQNELPPDSVPPIDDTPRYAKPQSVTIKRAGLVSVLQLVGASGGLKVIVAPGMPNPTIAAEYHDMTPMDMLRDLGHRYGFTPFDQGDGTVVAYPVVQDSKTPPTRNIVG